MNSLRLLRRTFFAAFLSIVIFASLLPTTLKSADDFMSDFSDSGAGYLSILYDSTNGLPTSDANIVIQTSDGFIWIGNYSGLIRYDGNTFYRYPASSGISSVVSLYEDSQKRLWVGTNDSGIAFLQNGTFTFYDQDDGLDSSSIRSICEDKDGNILIATTMGMAYIDSANKLHTIDDPQIRREYVCELVPSPDGKVFGVTLTGMFFTLENLRVSAFYNYENLGIPLVYTLYVDPDNPDYIYIGTEESEIIYGNIAEGFEDPTYIDVSPHVNVNSIRNFDGRIWVCTDNGIGYFDSDRVYHPLKECPMTTSIDRIMMDHEGNLWFSSSRQGVMKIVKNIFTDIYKLAKLDSVVVNSTCLHGENLYIGTDVGLTVLDGKYSKVSNTVTEMMDGVRIRCVFEDHDGNIWICSYGKGLICYNEEKDEVTVYSEENGLAVNRTRTIMQLQDGSMAVATNAGVNIIKDGKITAVYNESKGVSNPEILCLAQDDSGQIYMGSDGGGIFIVGKSSIKRIGIGDGLRSEVILRMVNDPVEDAMWVITSNSIAYLKDGKATTIRDFPYSNNFDLYFNSRNEMWILSSNGIYVVDRDNMVKNEAIEYTYYNTESGLPYVSTANSWCELTDDGVLYLSQSSGVSTVRINSDSFDNSTVKLIVPYIEADDELIYFDENDTIKIDSSTKRITIHPFVLTYTLNNPRISYKLEGFDDSSVELKKNELSNVIYTNLDGGSYVFTISVLNAKTGAVEKSVSVNIIKEKAIYETVWFFIILGILVVLLVVGIMLLINKRNTQKFLKKQKEDQKLIDEMTTVFSKCVDMKDAYTNGHSDRVAKYTAMIARQLGKSEEEVNQIHNIALLHDVGKISIPDKILNKPARLDDEEYAVMKTHSEKGREILEAVAINPELALGAGSHHERYDGKGYPLGLKGEEIPEVGQMIAVADTFDAMYSTRPYRKQMPLNEVVAELKRVSGTQLSPRMVDAFLEIIYSGAFNDINMNSSANDEQNAG